jgi:hypothetical protein
MDWTTEKPNYPCVFATREKIQGSYEYQIFILNWINSDEGRYLGWLSGDGDEYGDFSELSASEYFIIEKLEGK